MGLLIGFQIGRCKTKVNNVDCRVLENVIIPGFHLIDVNILAEHQVVEFQVIVNIACIVDLFKDIQNANAERVNGFS